MILRKLRDTDEISFKQAILEFKEHNPGWDFAFNYDEQVLFSDYVKQVNSWSLGKNLPEGFVSDSYMVAVVDNKIIGRVSLRHELNDFLFKLGGHIGYGVIPSFRQKGYAKKILKQTLPIAKKLGLEKVLLTCDEDNIASKKVIISNGGALERNNFDNSKLRFWIDL